MSITHGNIIVDQEVTFLKFSGLYDERLNFCVDEGHFYRGSNSSRKCADAQFFELFGTSTESIDCQAEPNSSHNHPVPSFESVEVSAIRWACRLRVLRFHEVETLVQSVDSVVSAWPRKISLSASTIKLMFAETLQKYRHMTKENKPYVRFFLTHYGDAELDKFRQAILQSRTYWPGSIPVITLDCTESVGPSMHNKSTKTSCRTILSRNQMLTELKRIVDTANDVRKNAKGIRHGKFRRSLDQFKDAVLVYLKKIKKSLISTKNKSISFQYFFENYPLFHPSRLENWLDYKLAEIQMADKIEDLSVSLGIPVFNQDKLEYELTYLTEHEFFLVLRISPLDECCRHIFKRMSKCFKKTTTNEKMLGIDFDSVKDVFPWYTIENKQNRVIEEIQSMFRHIAKQKLDLKKRVKFSIMFAEKAHELGCWYSIYNRGILVKDYVSTIPNPLTELCVDFTLFGSKISIDKVMQESNTRTQIKKQKRTKSPSRVLPSKKVKFQFPAYLESTLVKLRFAENIVKRCRAIGSYDGIDHYAIPLTKLTQPSDSDLDVAERFVFGKAEPLKQRKTILLIGDSGSWKANLINAMINYIFNTDLMDTFRFQIIVDQMDNSSDNSLLLRNRIYEINHHEGFQIPYSLVIVDTCTINRKFFKSCKSTFEIDMIGFVIQSSLSNLTSVHVDEFQSVLSHFGKDLKENISLLLTFSDSPVPAALNAIATTALPFPQDRETRKPLHCNFNSCGFFRNYIRDPKGDCASLKNFTNFFSKLSAMKTKSLSLTLEVLEVRKRLEFAQEELDSIIETGLNTTNEIGKNEKIIIDSQSQMEANKYRKNEWVYERIEPGDMSSISSSCLTCSKCDCKKNIIRLAFPMMNVPSVIAMEKYEAAKKTKLEAENLILMLKNIITENKKTEIQQRDSIANCIQKLGEIALHPNPLSPSQLEISN